MAMNSLNISLPEPLKAYVDAQVEQGAFRTPSDYIEQLVSYDRMWHSSEVEARLLAAVDSTDIDLSEEEIQSPHLLEILRKKLEIV